MAKDKVTEEIEASVRKMREATEKQVKVAQAMREEARRLRQREKT